MTTTTAPAVSSSASTFDGLYLRPNLASKGLVPSGGPYCMCPDIIGSHEPVDDPQTTFSTIESWGTMYATEPVPGEPTFYYVRGLNGAQDTVDGTLSLYWAPAQLVMFPSTWKVNELTPQNVPTVGFRADSGHIGVGDAPFVWPRPPVLPDAGEYVAFVAVASDSPAPAPPPSVASWLDMSALMTQRLDLGFRNTCYVDRTASSWTRRVRFDVPATMPAGAQLMITITASGFQDATVGLIADVFSADRKPMMISPIKIGDDPFTTGIAINVEPGLRTSFALQLWNGGAPKPKAGSTITLSADYVVPQRELAEAGQRALVDRTRSRFLTQAIGVGPQATAPLGAAVFVAG